MNDLAAVSTTTPVLSNDELEALFKKYQAFCKDTPCLATADRIEFPHRNHAWLAQSFVIEERDDIGGLTTEMELTFGQLGTSTLSLLLVGFNWTSLNDSPFMGHFPLTQGKEAALEALDAFCSEHTRSAEARVYGEDVINKVFSMIEAIQTEYPALQLLDK